MRAPSTHDLPPELERAASAVARRLAQVGRRGWIVGGAVRDLALGRTPHDVDMASAAPPEEVAGLFARTTSVGKAFGTVLVLDFGAEVQVTTFRAESGYSDGRRPDQVRYSETLEEDARRRDFTCNALYLDPLTGEVADPTGGQADLALGVLRCVGDAEERFREDGLRLLRLARFAAELDLSVEPGTLAAARRALEALRGVSAERLYAELAAMAGGRAPGRAFALLAETGVLERVLPGFAEDRAERLAVLSRLPAGAGLAAWLAALTGGAAAPLEGLRAPRAVLGAVARLARLALILDGLDGLDGAAAPRAERIRLVRDPAWADLKELAQAQGGARAARAAELERFRAATPAAELAPPPLLAGADLERAGVARGPRFGALLLELETLQLEGELKTRAEALAWLAARSGAPPAQG